MKTKLYLFAIVASAASVTAAPPPAPMPDLVTREWHSFPPDKVTSRIFGVIQWDQVPLIKIGISDKQLRTISPAVNPFGDVDGLIYAVTDNDEWTFTWVANNIWTYKRNQNNKENKSEMATPRKPSD